MAERPLSVLNKAAILAGHVIPVIFVRLDFLGGVLRVHSQIGPITWTHSVFGAETYLGIGDYGSVSAVQEALSTRPFGVTIKLTGVKGTLINDLLVDKYHRRSAHLFVGLNDASSALIDTPFEIWSGVMDKPDVAQRKTSGQIVMHCESRADIVHEPQGGVYNHETQTSIWPGDTGMEFMAKISMIGPIAWGDNTVLAPLGPGVRQPTEKKPGDR